MQEQWFLAATIAVALVVLCTGFGFAVPFAVRCIVVMRLQQIRDEMYQIALIDETWFKEMPAYRICESLVTMAIHYSRFSSESRLWQFYEILASVDDSAFRDVDIKKTARRLLPGVWSNRPRTCVAAEFLDLCQTVKLPLTIRVAFGGYYVLPLGLLVVTYVWLRNCARTCFCGLKDLRKRGATVPRKDIVTPEQRAMTIGPVSVVVERGTRLAEGPRYIDRELAGVGT